MILRRGKTIAERYAEQHEESKRKKPLTAKHKKKIDQFRQRIAETSEKNGLKIKNAEIR